jgi:hypothetical protein
VNSHITYRQLSAVLQATGEAFVTLPLADGFQIIVTQRGGRVFGPFAGDDGESLTWINAALANAADFTAFRAAGQWNVGGERVWIAPEVQYNIRNRADFWGSHHVPAAMDPAEYRLETVNGGARLRATMPLQAYNLSDAATTLEVEKHIRLIGNPLRALHNADALMQGVRCAAYETAVSLAFAQGTAGTPVSESWNLTQLNAGGTLYIPCTAGAQVSPFFGDPAADALHPLDGAYRIQLTGQRQYKTGYKAAGMRGVMGYLHALSPTQSYLLVRSFFNNPSAVYAEEVPDIVGANGHSVHVYNDGGQFGGNGEMEASGQAIGGNSGRSHTHDAFIMSVFVGATPQLQRIMDVLLGVRP